MERLSGAVIEIGSGLRLAGELLPQGVRYIAVEAASDARRTRLIAGNIRSAGAAEFVTRLAGFGLIVLLARELGEVELGRYLVALSLVALLAGMAELAQEPFSFVKARNGRTCSDVFSRFASRLRLGWSASLSLPR